MCIHHACAMLVQRGQNELRGDDCELAWRQVRIASADCKLFGCLAACTPRTAALVSYVKDIGEAHYPARCLPIRKLAIKNLTLLDELSFINGNDATILSPTHTWTRVQGCGRLQSRLPSASCSQPCRWHLPQVQPQYTPRAMFTLLSPSSY